MRKALVQKSTGLVLNVIEIANDAVWTMPEGCSLIDAELAGGPGDTWDGKVFIPAPAPPAPKPTLEERVTVLETKVLRG